MSYASNASLCSSLMSLLLNFSQKYEKIACNETISEHSHRLERSYGQ